MPLIREVDPQPPSPDAIQAGLPAESYVRLRTFLGATDQQLAEHLSIPMRTLQRRLAGNRFSSEEADRLTRLVRISKEAASTLGDLDSAREWMLTPNPSLDFKTPLELTATDTGCVEVERLLIRIEYGVF
jgi:putative toxin-antitoxin system antitoxin component (TIGR02293 family)